MPPVAKSIKALRKGAALRSESLEGLGRSRGRTPGARLGEAIANPVVVSQASGGSSFRLRDAFKQTEAPEAAAVGLLIQKPQGPNKATLFLGRPPSLSKPSQATNTDATRNASRQLPLTQGIQAFASGGAYPMFIGMVFMAWYHKFLPGGKKLKQLPPPSKESSSQSLAVRKNDSEALAVRKTEIKAIDGTRKNLFRNESIKGRFKRFIRGFKFDTLEEAIVTYGGSAVSGAAAGWWFGGAYYVSLGPFLFYTIAFGLSSIIGLGTSNAIRRRGLLAGVRRIQGNSKEIKKLRGDKIPDLDSSDINIHQALSNHPKYSLELLAARALKDAPPKMVESWMNEMFGDNLPAKLQWIRRGKVRGGSQLLIDLLKVGDLTKPEILWIFDTLAKLKAEEALLLYEGLEKSLPKKWEKLGVTSNDIVLAWVQLETEVELKGKATLKRISLGHPAGSLSSHWETHPFDPRIARLYFKMGFHEEILMEFKKIEDQLDPTDPGYLEMADILVSSGNQKAVVTDIIYWAHPIRRLDLDPALIKKAIIVGKAGYFEEAVTYLRKVEELPELNLHQKLDLATAYLELGLKLESRAIAEKLLTDPDVDIEAAELMDKLKKGWDDFIPIIGLKQFGPHR